MANTYFKKSKFRPKFRATQCPGRDQEKLSYAVYLLYIKLPLLLLSLSMNLKKNHPAYVFLSCPFIYSYSVVKMGFIRVLGSSRHGI